MTKPTPPSAFTTGTWNHYFSRPNKEGTLTPAGTITDIFGTSDGYLLNLEVWCPGTTIWHWTDGDMSFPMNPYTRKPVGTDGEDLDGTFLYERASTPPMTDADYKRLAQAALECEPICEDGRQEICLDPTTLLDPNHNLDTSPIDVERAMAALRAEGVTVEHYQPWTESEGTPILFVQAILAPTPTEDAAVVYDAAGYRVGTEGDVETGDGAEYHGDTLKPCPECGGHGLDCTVCHGDGVIYPY